MAMTWPSREIPGERTRKRAGLGRELAAFATPLAAFAAMASFASLEVDPASGAEGAFLARVAAGVLLAVAALAPAPAIEVALGPVLSTLAVWALPPGPVRGAAVAALLATCLAVAAARRLTRALPVPPVAIAEAERQIWSLPKLPFEVSLPLALGLQVLVRGNVLLVPALAPRPLVVLLVLPVAAAAALSLLAKRHGGGRALLAGAVAVLLGPGWTVATTAALVPLVAGSVLGGPLPRRARDRWLVQAAVMAALVAPIAWEPRAGILGAVAGLALWRPGLGLAVSAAVAAVVTAAFIPAISKMPAAGLLLQAKEQGTRIDGWLALPLLVPAALLPERERWQTALAALLLAAASIAVPGPAAAAAPLALAALCVPARGASMAVQGVWSGFLVTCTALGAAYPWLREVPLPAVLSPLGSPGRVALAAAVTVLLLGGGQEWLQARPWKMPRSSARPATTAAMAAIAASILLAALLTRAGQTGTTVLLAGSAVQISAESPSWEIGFSPQPVGSLVVDSALANSATLAPGTPVATLRLGGGSGPEIAWTLRAGRQTGEWAARRPDIAQAAADPSRPAPPAWISFVAGDFFGQRYRGVFRATGGRPFAHLRIERAAGLPAEVGLSVHRLELRR